MCSKQSSFIIGKAFLQIIFLYFLYSKSIVLQNAILYRTGVSVQKRLCLNITYLLIVFFSNNTTMFTTMFNKRET